MVPNKRINDSRVRALWRRFSQPDLFFSFFSRVVLAWVPHPHYELQALDLRVGVHVSSASADGRCPADQHRRHEGRQGAGELVDIVDRSLCKSCVCRFFVADDAVSRITLLSFFVLRAHLGAMQCQAISPPCPWFFLPLNHVP